MEGLKMEGLKKALTNTYTRYYSSLIREGHFDKIVPEFKFLRDQQLTKTSDVKTSEYIFITLSPDPKLCPLFSNWFDVFSGAKKSLVNKKWMTDILYCYEQRRTNELDLYRFYSYLIVKRNGKKMFDIRKEFKSTLKAYIDNPSILNFKNIKDDTDLQRMVTYMIGLKKDHDRQDFDKIFRKKYGIEPYYKKNDHYDKYIDVALGNVCEYESDSSTCSNISKQL